jgi:hypothetical protein
MTERSEKILLLDDDRDPGGLPARLEFVPEIRDQTGPARGDQERPRRTGKAREVPDILAPRNEEGFDTVGLHELFEPRETAWFGSIFHCITCFLCREDTLYRSQPLDDESRGRGQASMPGSF